MVKLSNYHNDMFLLCTHNAFLFIYFLKDGCSLLLISCIECSEQQCSLCSSKCGLVQIGSVYFLEIAAVIYVWMS